MAHHLKEWSGRAVPAVIALAAAGAAACPPSWFVVLDDNAARVGILGAIALAGITGWAFKHVHFLWIAIVLAAAEGALLSLPRAMGAAPAVAVALAVPPAIFAAACLPERGVVTRSGALMLVGFVAIAAAVLFGPRLGLPQGDGAQVLRMTPFDEGAWRLPLMPTALALAFGVGVALAARAAPERIALLSLMATVLVAANAHPALWGEPQREGLQAGLCAAMAGVLLYASLHACWRAAYTDELTGLPGRRALEHHLRTLPRRYAIGMVDIDHFKRVNDRHGHAVGDQALRFVASHLRRMRGVSSYRYGGEEFAVVMPQGDVDAARAKLESLRAAVAKSGFALRAQDRPRQSASKAKPARGAARKARNLKLTLSAGVADSTEGRSDAAAVLRAADQALYRAKHAGRNRVHTA